MDSLDHRNAEINANSAKRDFGGNSFQWSKELISKASEHWNISEFRPNQIEIMNAIMAGRDTFVIMPTGGGKQCF